MIVTCCVEFFVLGGLLSAGTWMLLSPRLPFSRAAQDDVPATLIYSRSQWEVRWGMYREVFGKRFSQLMEEKGWTDRQAGSILGVSQTMIFKYRQGLNFPESELLFRIADILDVSVDWLGGRTKIRELPSDKDHPQA